MDIKRKAHTWHNSIKAYFGFRKKIRIILTGGLGNQLFQYAAARAIAFKKEADVCFEISAFRKDKFYQRQFNLSAFEYPSTLPVYVKPFVSKTFARLRDMRQKKWFMDGFFSLFGYIERTLTFDKDLMDDQPWFSQTMVGYWQDERYFRDYRDVLLQDLRPGKRFSPRNETIARYINDLECPVAVHVRYNHEVKSDDNKTQDDRRAANVSAVWVGSRYYDLAHSYLISTVKSPSYIVFSDNPSWVKENLTMFNDRLVLEAGRGEDWEDMLLMTRCKHHIIANSSFSWWGAWLCEDNEKVVIAPKDFLYTPSLPTSWIAIDPR